MNPTGSGSQPFNFETENKFLKITITALRDKMEDLKIKQEENIQRAKAGSADEISQLQQTVNALRAEMEKTQISKEEEIQLAVSKVSDQNTQLKGTVNSLRQELEKSLHSLSNELASLSQKFVNEVGNLAEKEGHHPDISFGWGYAIIKIYTHSVEGLSENDFILASKIDKSFNV